MIRPDLPPSGRVTANPDGTRKWGYVRVGDDLPAIQRTKRVRLLRDLFVDSDSLALFVAQSDGRVHSHSCASGNENRNKGHETQKDRNNNEGEGIVDADLEQKTL